MPRDPEGGSPWQVPVAVQLGRGTPFASNAGQQAGALTPHTPVGRDLARAPEQALGIALGPGFGRNSARNLLVAQAPILMVMLLWLLLGAVVVGGKLNMALVLAPTLVFANGMTPLARRLVLFWQPRRGLHELALLPGLPPQPVPALARALAKQVPVRALPALALVLAFAVASGASAEYCALLAWASLGSLSLAWGWTLVALHSHAGRWSVLVLSILLLLGEPVMLVANEVAGPIRWLPPLCAAALVAGLVLQALGIRRLRALPHPWLGN